jgi:small nuclear ribonucleoprotein (snRNP)-like protein
LEAPQAHCIFQAYDSHCNVVLGDVEEMIYMIEEDDDGEETVKVCTPTATDMDDADTLQTIKKQSEMLFVRGKILSSYDAGPRLSCIKVTP